MNKILYISMLFIMGCATQTKKRSLASFPSDYNHLLYNDLRDIVAGDADVGDLVKGTIRYIKKNHTNLAGFNCHPNFADQTRKHRLNTCYTLNEINTLGPIGELNEGTDFEANLPHGTQNVLLGFYFDTLIVSNDNNFRGRVVITLFRDSKLFFKVGEIERVNGVFSVSSKFREVNVSNTNFELIIELATQKAILMDRENQITIAFPVAVGAFEVPPNFKHGQLLVSFSQLDQVNREDRSAALANSSILVPYSKFESFQNTFSRFRPAEFAGRPMIAILDKNRPQRQFPIMFLSAYKNTDEDLDSPIKRGFTTRGGIHLTDRDLYLLSAIVNQSGSGETKIIVKMNFEDQYRTITSQYPRHEKVLQSTFSEGQKNITMCNEQSGLRYRHRNYINKETNYHTVVNDDCSTMLSESGNYTTSDIMRYIFSEEGVTPRAVIE